MKVEEKSSHLPTESELLLLVAEVEKRILESKLPLIPKTDYEFIVKFVRTKKFNVEKATKAIQKYYESIFRILRRIEGTKPSLYSSVFASNSMAILKHRINDQRILHANFRNWDTKEFGMREIQCAGLFVVEELLAEVETQLNGAIIICDLDGFGFSHLRQCTIPEVKIAIQTVLDGVPAKVKGIHLLNVPTIFWPIYKIVSKLLPEKMQKRVNFHSNLESLHKCIDKNVLPTSLGGILDDDEALDTELLDRLLTNDPCYDDYWNGDTNRRPRRLTRKRSSMMMTSFEK